MRVYFISLFNLFALQELRLMAGIGIEVGLGIGIELGLQELRSKLVTGIKTGS